MRRGARASVQSSRRGEGRGHVSGDRAEVRIVEVGFYDISRYTGVIDRNNRGHTIACR